MGVMMFCTCTEGSHLQHPHQALELLPKTNSWYQLTHGWIAWLATACVYISTIITLINLRAKARIEPRSTGIRPDTMPIMQLCRT